MPPHQLALLGDQLVFSTLNPGVYTISVRGGQPAKVDASWIVSMVGDGDAAYFVATPADADRHDGAPLIRLARDGTETELARWNGWVTAVDDEYVYLLDRARGPSARVPKHGGKPVALPCRGSIAADREWLYCLERRTITRFDKTGKRVTQLTGSTKGTLTEGPVVTERYVYASTEQPDAIVRVRLGGGKLEVVAPDVGNVYNLAADGAEAYWVETHHPGPRKMVIRRVRDDANAPDDFIERIGYGRALAFASDRVFIADSGTQPERDDPPRLLEVQR